MAEIRDLLAEPPARYECPACPKRFKSVGEKKAHIRAEHPR